MLLARSDSNALAVAPNYALACYGLAQSYLSQACFGVMPWKVAHEQGRLSAMRALELDETQPQAAMGINI